MNIIKLIKKEPCFYLFKKVWRFSVGVRIKLLSAFLLSIAVTSLFATLPLFIGKLINQIQLEGVTQTNIGDIFGIIFILVSICFLLTIFAFVWSVQGEQARFQIFSNYQSRLIKKTLQLDLHWRADKNSGSIIDKINIASTGMKNSATDLESIIANLVTLIVSVSVLVYFDIFIGISAFFVFGFLFLVHFFFHEKIINPKTTKYLELQNKISSKMFDGFSNFTTIIMLGLQKTVSKNISFWIYYPKKLVHKIAKVDGVREAFSFSGTGIFLYLFFGIYLYILYASGEFIEAGSLVIVFLYLEKIQNYFQLFSHNYNNVLQDRIKIENVSSIEKDFKKELVIKKPVYGWEDFSVSNLSFTYEEENKKKKHLDDISFYIKKGERVALIGGSGAGKTTLLKTIAGLYNNVYCDLKIDKVETKDINLYKYDFGISIIPQDPELFSETIRENITIGLDYTDKQIKKVTDITEFTDVIKRLPNGVESKINEKGVNLSGGEKQRLALSRSLLLSETKDMLFFDESTSSVDSFTENKIYEKVFYKYRDKSILASIHKLNLLKFFDRIIILEDGKIIDTGNFEELLDRNKKFKSDWEKSIKKK